MRKFCLLLLLMVPVLADADVVALDTSKVSTFEFRKAQFGKPPMEDMFCYHGDCKSQAPDGDGQVKIPFNVYTRSSDLALFAGVEISPPRYSYWKDQLFRIFIPINCTLDNANECLKTILDEISMQDPLTLLAAESADLPAQGLKMFGKSYLTNSGALLATRRTEENGQQELFIDIWDKKLMDEVRLAVNPKYRPQKVFVPLK